MKNIFKLAFVAIASILFISSCKKDEGKLPTLTFKVGTTYLSTDDTLTIDSAFVIGVDAAKSEEKDVLKKLNISKSLNGGTAVSVFTKDLSGAEGDNYSYDYSGTAEHTAGQSAKYIFTITNRDGITNQLKLTVVSQ